MKPHVCLLPGLDGTGLLFGPLLGSLAGRCDATVVTHSQADSFEELIAEIEGQLPGDRKIFLVAESFSGPAAIEIMVRQKLDIGASVLCATFCTSPFMNIVRLAEYVPDFLFGAQVIRKAVINSMGIDGSIDARLKFDLYRIMESETPELVKKRLKILTTIDVTDKARSVHVPILYLRASRDRMVSKRLGQRMIDSLPHVQVEEVNGPHLLLQMEPDACAELIMKHVDTPSATDPKI